MPEFVGKAAKWLVEQRGAPFVSALDAGCGTGLAGPYLRPLVTGSLVGADLSEKMLARAAKVVGEDGGKVYDSLLSKDLLSLQHADVISPQGAASGEGVELIVAADVLVYFGDLDELLRAFGSLASGRGASMVFSCERFADDASQAFGSLCSAPLARCSLAPAPRP